MLMSLLCLFGLGQMSAQQAETEKKDVKEANIVFDKTTMDVGTFSADEPVVKTTFTFTNQGMRLWSSTRLLLRVAAPCPLIRGCR